MASRYTKVCAVAGCNTIFRDKTHRVEHERIHNGETPFVCPVAPCSKSFGRWANLKRHAKTHSQPDLVRYNVMAVVNNMDRSLGGGSGGSKSNSEEDDEDGSSGSSVNGSRGGGGSSRGGSGSGSGSGRRCGKSNDADGLDGDGDVVVGDYNNNGGEDESFATPAAKTASRVIISADNNVKKQRRQSNTRRPAQPPQTQPQLPPRLQLSDAQKLEVRQAAQVLTELKSASRQLFASPAAGTAGGRDVNYSCGSSSSGISNLSPASSTSSSSSSSSSPSSPGLFRSSNYTAAVANVDQQLQQQHQQQSRWLDLQTAQSTIQVPVPLWYGAAAGRGSGGSGGAQL
jgi:hypothetical protein